MRITYPLLVFTLLTSYSLLAQSTNDFLIGASMDVVKTDIDKVFDKAQMGLEVNYFIQRRFAVGSGAEIRTSDLNYFFLGARWYKNDNLYLRFRALIRTGSSDAALGIGYSKPINRNFRAEVMGDLYFKHPDFALRGGIAYVINYVKQPIRTGN